VVIVSLDDAGAHISLFNSAKANRHLDAGCHSKRLKADSVSLPRVSARWLLESKSPRANTRTNNALFTAIAPAAADARLADSRTPVRERLDEQRVTREAR
jgi:hypothetical protein